MPDQYFYAIIHIDISEIIYGLILNEMHLFAFLSRVR